MTSRIKSQDKKRAFLALDPWLLILGSQHLALLFNAI